MVAEPNKQVLKVFDARDGLFELRMVDAKLVSADEERSHSLPVDLRLGVRSSHCRRCKRGLIEERSE